MENGAFAPKEQMLAQKEQMPHYLQYFQICDISKASKGIIMKKGERNYILKGYSDQDLH